MRTPRGFAWSAAVVAMLVVALAPPAEAAAPKRPLKEFKIAIAEHELFPGGPKIHAWAFNGQVPGPVLRVIEGDLVRVHLTNNHTSNGHLGHLEVTPGESRTYEFVADPAGTHMYRPRTPDCGSSTATSSRTSRTTVAIRAGC